MSNVIFALVVASRFLVPLAIPRFPLPAILVALVIDAADQTVFAAFDVEPDNYQGYDKALDIYYLTIAYVATIRNWTDGVAFTVGQVLWYYRLIGVVAFELLDIRALLLVFPNTFEYFFIVYEAVRLRWEPGRLGSRQVVGLAVAIWVFVKLPQEWWIHIARLDVTDVVGDAPWLLAVIAVVAAACAAAIWANRDRIPAADWPLSVDVDTHPTTVIATRADPPTGRWAPINLPIVEKTVLVGLVTVIFLQLVPDVDATLVETVAAVGVIIVANAAIGRWLVRLGTTWRSTATQFVTMAVVNLNIVVAATIVFGRERNGGEGVQLGLSLFLLALMTLIATLYDRYRTLRIKPSRAALRPEGLALL